MKIKLLFVTFLISAACYGQSYKEIHTKAIVLDSHNDILMQAYDKGDLFDRDLTGKTHTDLDRWKAGGLDVQIFSVYCDGAEKDPYTVANKQMDILDALVIRNTGKIAKASSYADIVRIVNEKKIAAMFGVEGGHMIEDKLENLDKLYHRGARYLTLTHNVAPAWATSAADETSKKNLSHKGLTDFGKEVVKRMNHLGMLVDVSHAGEQTFWDVIRTTTKPIIASHSSVYSLTPHRRNLKDEQIKAIAKNKGVIQINFNPGFIDSSFHTKESAFLKKHVKEVDSLNKAGVDEFYQSWYLNHKYASEVNPTRPPLALVIQHIDYIVKLVGTDFVGLGSDFDGITLTPQGLDDVTAYPMITKSLVDKGYSEKDITKILGGNFLRVLKANESH